MHELQPDHFNLHCSAMHHAKNHGLNFQSFKCYRVPKPNSEGKQPLDNISQGGLSRETVK